MIIPDEAVEAAIASVYGESDLPEKLGEFGAEVRTILEAAAPYIVTHPAVCKTTHESYVEYSQRMKEQNPPAQVYESTKDKAATVVYFSRRQRECSKTERDELAELIWQHTDGTDESAPDIAADRIISAGWRKISSLRWGPFCVG